MFRTNGLRANSRLGRALAVLALSAAVIIPTVGPANATPVVLSADGFYYTVASGNATVTGCTSTCDATLVIPATLDGNPVKVIGTGAFNNEGLTSVSIPDSVTSIGYNAFNGNSLTSVTISDNVTSVGELAFNNNNLSSVVIGSSVTTIGVNAFNNNNLSSVTIPSSVTSIGNYAFANNSLTAVTVPNSVTTIGNYAFADNSLTTAIVGSAVTSLGTNAFSNNANLSLALFRGNKPTAGLNVFAGTSVTKISVKATAGGWSSTFQDIEVVLVTVPTPPSVTGFDAGDGEATVTFAAPGTTGNLAITDFKVEYKATSAGSWSTFSHAASASVLSYTITGLTNGTSYDVRVSAVNAYGTSLPSGSESATPVTNPGIPTISSLIAGNGQATVTFVAPASDGGSAITKYVVEWKASDGEWLFVNADEVSPSTLSYTITGLINGAGYDVRVSAVTGVGAGVADSASVLLPTAPSSPTISSLIAGNGEATVSFDAPASDGGSAVTDYKVEYRTSSDESWSTFSHAASASGLSYTITGLSNGTSYDVRVSAVNTVGVGDASEISLVTPATTPGIPTISSLTAGDSQLTINFTAPADNGGSAITDYQYSIDNGFNWLTAGVTASPIVVTGLTNGTEYQVKLRAVNTVGAGDASNSASVTPVTVPGAPTVTSVTPGDSELTINFTAPADNGGSAITDYEYSIDNGFNWVTASAIRPILVTGLTNGTEYQVKLRAVNSVGFGSANSATSGTPAIPTYSGDGFDYRVSGGKATVTRCTSTCPVALVIPATLGGYDVVSIASNAFKNKNLTSVSIPSSVTSIGTNAFTNNGLTSVTIPTGVTTIGYAAFKDNRLTAVTIPDSVTSIGELAFANNSLTSLTLGSSVEIIGVNAFSDNALTSVTIPDSVTSIGNSAFAFNNLKSVNVPGAVRTIGNYAFAYNELRSAIVGGAVTSLGTGAFSINPDLAVAIFKGNKPTAGAYIFVGSTALTQVSVFPAVTGWGATFQTFPVVQVTTAGAPSVSSFTAGNTQATVTFTAPANDGNLAITDYTVEYKATSSGSWSTFSHDASASTLSYTITGLTNGTSYDVRVSAVNALGTGSASDTSSVVLPTVPGAPSVSTLTAGNGAATVKFTAPADNGGSDITDYTVEYKRTTSGSWSTFSHDASASTLSYTITGLSNATSYDVRVSAVNAVGAGSASDSSSVVTTTAVGSTVASIIWGVGRGNQQVSIGTYGRPSLRASEIIGYEYTLNDGENWLPVDASSTATVQVIKGLTNGTRYTVKVRAVNAAGPGASSKAISFVPSAPVSAPTNVRATAHSRSVTLTFDAPADNGGTAIIRYGYSINGGAWKNVGLAQSVQIGRLVNGTQYSIRVVAQNAAGHGIVSNEVLVTPNQP